MKITADLHIHSKYARATAKNADLEHFYIAAQLRGVNLLSTGDFTHPAWMAELQEKLVPASSGTYRLRPEIRRVLDREVPPSCRSDVRFLLGTEISCIYKKNGRTRKNHNLVFMPDFSSAEKFSAGMSKAFNLASDGRPIIGMDARDLLEKVLETTREAFMIPAHIWTPWFSLFGVKSGFDSMEECFEDLTPHIFALETGLSSDPAMNSLVSELDHITMVSFSDAHSPGKIGREATILETEFSFPAIRSAMDGGDPNALISTVEFYPELGKYHVSGHRKCGTSQTPEETSKTGGLCPLCGKPLTLGVLHRIHELADRSRPGGRRAPFACLVPMEMILSNILGVGPDTKKVAGALNKIRKELGPDLKTLMSKPVHGMVAELEIAGLAKAIARVQKGHLKVTPGFDGEFGKVLFL